VLEETGTRGGDEEDHGGYTRRGVRTLYVPHMHRERRGPLHGPVWSRHMRAVSSQDCHTGQRQVPCVPNTAPGIKEDVHYLKIKINFI